MGIKKEAKLCDVTKCADTSLRISVSSELPCLFVVVSIAVVVVLAPPNHVSKAFRKSG